MAAQKKTPAWAWIGCGCLLLIVLVVAVIGGAGYWGVSQFKSMVDDMADPLARDEATMRLLGAEKLPEGWHAHVFFQIPFIMKIAMLTDGALGESIEGGFEEKAEALENMRLERSDFNRNIFIFFRIKGRGDGELEDLIAGRRSPGGGAQMDLDIDIETGEALDEGTLQIGEQTIEWRAQTGVMEVVGGTLEGIYAAVRIRCPEGEDADALWFQTFETGGAAQAPEAAQASEAGATAAASAAVETSLEQAPDGEASAASIEIDGSPADPAAIEWLFSHFQLCR